MGPAAPQHPGVTEETLRGLIVWAKTRRDEARDGATKASWAAWLATVEAALADLQMRRATATNAAGASVPGVDWLALTEAERGTIMEYAMARLRGLAEPPEVADGEPFRGTASWYRLSEAERERLIEIEIAELRRVGLARAGPAPQRWLVEQRYAEPTSPWAGLAADGPDLIERSRGDAGIERRRRMLDLRRRLNVMPFADRQGRAGEALRREIDELLAAERAERTRRNFGTGEPGGGLPTGA